MYMVFAKRVIETIGFTRHSNFLIIIRRIALVFFTLIFLVACKNDMSQQAVETLKAENKSLKIENKDQADVIVSLFVNINNIETILNSDYNSNDKNLQIKKIIQESIDYSDEGAKIRKLLNDFEDLIETHEKLTHELNMHNKNITNIKEAKATLNDSIQRLEEQKLKISEIYEELYSNYEKLKIELEEKSNYIEEINTVSKDQIAEIKELKRQLSIIDFVEYQKMREDIAEYKKIYGSLTPYSNRPDINPRDITIISPISINSNNTVLSINSNYRYPFVITRVDITEIKFNYTHFGMSNNYRLSPIVFNDINYEVDGSGNKTVTIDRKIDLPREFRNASPTGRSCVITIYFETAQHKKSHSFQNKNATF
jgi:hypothetical protein